MESDLDARLEALRAAAADEALLVADSAAAGVAGFLHVCARTTLTRPPLGEVLALVVFARERGRGAGQALVAAAEEWCRARSLVRVRVRSRVERDGARRFYERAGYRVVKTQRVFEKELSPDTGRTR